MLSLCLCAYEVWRWEFSHYFEVQRLIVVCSTCKFPMGIGVGGGEAGEWTRSHRPNSCVDTLHTARQESA